MIQLGNNGIQTTVISCPIKTTSSGQSIQLLFQYDTNTKTGTCKFPSQFIGYTGLKCSRK